MLTMRANVDSDVATAYPVALDWTPCPFGGARPWFRCPLVVDGEPCRHRVRILYRPWGARYFGCRHCHHLTYRTLHVTNRTFSYQSKLLALVELRATAVTL